MEFYNEIGEQMRQEGRVGYSKKSWAELGEVVGDLRRRLSGMLSGSIPGSVSFRSLPDGRYAIKRKKNGPKLKKKNKNFQ